MFDRTLGFWTLGWSPKNWIQWLIEFGYQDRIFSACIEHNQIFISFPILLNFSWKFIRYVAKFYVMTYESE